jgi:hypothetical protein
VLAALLCAPPINAELISAIAAKKNNDTPNANQRQSAGNRLALGLLPNLLIYFGGTAI